MISLSLRSAVSVLCLSALVACAPGRPIDRQLVSEPDPVALRLASAADRSSAALQTLAAVEQARTPQANMNLPPAAPQELRRTVTVNWNGPITGIAKTLADRAGYRLDVTGATPPVPVVVNISAYQRPVIEVLRDVGLQAGSRASVIVDSDRRVVEIVYATIEG